MTRGVLFYIFVNLFDVWLNKGQLDSHIHFCMQSGGSMQLSLKNMKKIQLHTDMKFENGKII